MDQCYRRPAAARPPRTSVDRVRVDQSRVKHLIRGRSALVHPPWFDDEVNELGASYFASQDVTVIMSASADLANEPGRIETEAVVEWVTRNAPDNAEAIFFGGNGFLTAGTIDRLETTEPSLSTA
jgi:maleate cis-trans isomerase